jgi:hypothetical protein
MTNQTGDRHGITINQQLLHCIQECTSCHAVCLHTMTVMLFSEHLAQDNRLAQLLLDCADICQTSADFMLRGSSLHGLTCEACSRICEASAQACEQIANDENLRACAESCRSCAATCQEMAAAAPNWRDQVAGM